MFATEFQTVKVIPLGGGWAFAIGYIDGGNWQIHPPTGFDLKNF